MAIGWQEKVVEMAEKEEKKYEAQSLQSQARQRIGDIELRLQTLLA